MKRRNFLRMTGPMAFTPVVMNKSILKPFATGSLKRLFGCEEVNDRHLIVVQIKGGNDGLNNIIPLAQYDLYKSFRPKIGIAQSDLINLDTGLSVADQIGLHPSLSPFKTMYERDEFSFVQAVGYANNNKSHFKGTDIWLSGGDSTNQKNNINSGWMGRYLDHSYPGLAGEPTVEHPDPLGIQLGSKQQSLGFHTEEQHEAGINLSGQDPGGFYTLVSEIGGLPPTGLYPSDYSANIEYIVDIEQSTNKYARRITEVFEAGTNLAGYPAYDLANQLKTVARLIRGGIKTKIFIVTIGGFDTHINQVDTTDAKKGVHATLLQQMSESIMAFQDDINQLGLADRVAGVTFSEFGRRPKENDGVGTDHGSIAPMYLFGKGVKSQILGSNVDLSLVTGSANDLVGMQMDYRNVFTALLQDWLGASDNIISDTLFEEYLASKAPVVENTFKVKPECYIDNYLNTNWLDSSRRFNIFPNPASQFIKFQLNLVFSASGSLRIYDMQGRICSEQIFEQITGDHIFDIPVVNLWPGNYTVQVTFADRSLKFSSKFTKI